MKTSLTILFFFAISANISAQKEQTHWYMGGRYGIKFENGLWQALPEHPNTSLDNFNTSNGNNASISNPRTGQFLFQANGPRVLDRDFNIMPGGKTIGDCAYSLIVPFLFDTSK